MIEHALMEVLDASPAIAAAFGQPARIHPDELPQGTAYPAALYLRASDMPISGAREDTDWRRCRMQFSVFAPHRAEVREAARAIAQTLRRYRGTHGAVVIDDCRCVLEQDLFEDAAALRHVVIDFEIHYQEA